MAKTQDTRWDDVRVFLAAYRDGSLGVAAEHLGIDVSTASRRLSAFEETIGVRLFDRTRQGLVPLRAAEVVLAAAETMEAAHRRLTRDASSVDAEVEGVVRLSVAPGMAEVFVTPALAELRALHPRLCVELDASARVLDLARHEADLALRSVKPAGAELVVTKLTTAPWVAAVGWGLFARLGELESWEDVPWIAWDRDMSSLHVARWLAKHAPRAEVSLRTSHFASQMVAAESDMGAILVPQPYLRGRKLVPVAYRDALGKSAAEWPADTLWLVGHQALRDVPRVAAVWSFLRALPWEAEA